MYTRFANMGLFFLVAVIFIICAISGMLVMRDQHFERENAVGVSYEVSGGYNESEREPGNSMPDKKPDNADQRANNMTNRSGHP